MNEKTLYPLSVGVETAANMIDLLEPVCRRVEIAGSVRRKRTQVHDVDLVIWPKSVKIPQMQIALFQSDSDPDLNSQVSKPASYHPKKLFDLARMGGWGDWGPGDWPRIIHTEASATVDYIPIELYLCEPDGGNFEALLQMRTGSAEYNIRLARRAQELGLHYVAGHGIFDGMNRVDDGTEAGIWAALGWEYVPPERRG